VPFRAAHSSKSSEVKPGMSPDNRISCLIPGDCLQTLQTQVHQDEIKKHLSIILLSLLLTLEQPMKQSMTGLITMPYSFFILDIFL